MTKSREVDLSSGSRGLESITAGKEQWQEQGADWSYFHPLIGTREQEVGWGCKPLKSASVIYFLQQGWVFQSFHNPLQTAPPTRSNFKYMSLGGMFFIHITTTSFQAIPRRLSDSRTWSRYHKGYGGNCFQRNEIWKWVPNICDWRWRMLSEWMVTETQLSILGN